MWLHDGPSTSVVLKMCEVCINVHVIILFMVSHAETVLEGI